MAKTDSDPNSWMETSVPTSYEKVLVETMWEYGVTLAEAMYIDMQGNCVDTCNVYDVVDFLEERLECLNKVQYYMQVFTGQVPDVILRKNDDDGQPG